MTLTVAEKFRECWDAEIEDRKKRSPSFKPEEFTATGRASAKYGGCSIEGCERKHNARGLCTTHYERWRKNGDPLVSGRPTALERFASKIEFNQATGCIDWIAKATDGKYGSFNFEGKNWKAHRWAYEHLVEPVDPALDLDHLCRNTLCVNPDHLEPVTRSENLRRGAAARKLEAAA